MAKILGAITLTEDSSTSLKNIDGDYVSHDDVCIVVDENWFYIYVLENSSLEQNIPDVIEPYTNSTNKRWILRSLRKFTEDVSVKKDNKLTVSKIYYNDDDGVSFYTRNNQEIMRIDQNNVVLNKELLITSNNLNIGSLNNINLSEFILRDGSVAFTDQVQGIYPEADEDLATKKFVLDSVGEDFNTMDHISEPNNPEIGQSVMYSSDGSASDETEGDLVLKINIGGIVKKTILASYGDAKFLTDYE